MKTTFFVVWLLSSGQFAGEPFQEFDSFEACEAYRNGLTTSSKDKIAFAAGCLEQEAVEQFNHKFIGILFSYKKKGIQ